MEMNEDRWLVVANLLLMVAAAPALLNAGAAVPRWQSAITVVGLLIVGVANWSLGVRKSAILAFLSAVEWGLIFWLRPI